MIPDNWPPPVARKEQMKASTAVLAMAFMSIVLLGLGMLALGKDWGGAGWTLIIVGCFSALSTIGSLARLTK